MKDRTFKLLLTLIAVALWAIVLRPLWEPTPAQAQGGTTGTAKYEYWIAVGDDSDEMETTLDKAGKNGWQAVGFAVHPVGNFASPQVIALMERRIE